jgi:hypothetical protein
VRSESEWNGRGRGADVPVVPYGCQDVGQCWGRGGGRRGEDFAEDRGVDEGEEGEGPGEDEEDGGGIEEERRGRRRRTGRRRRRRRRRGRGTIGGRKGEAKQTCEIRFHGCFCFFCFFFFFFFLLPSSFVVVYASRIYAVIYAVFLPVCTCSAPVRFPFYESTPVSAPLNPKP